MTVERTRQILKQKVAHLTDEEILVLINRTEKSLDHVFFLAVKKAHAKKKGADV